MQREISGYLRSRKRKDGRREGRCTVRYDQRGKRIIKNDLGKTQAEVKAKLSMEIAEYRKVCITRSGKHAVAEWLRPRFELYAKSSIRRSTARYCRRAMEEYTIPRIGHIKLNKRTIGKFRNSIRTCWKTGGHGKNSGRSNQGSAAPPCEADSSLIVAHPQEG